MRINYAYTCLCRVDDLSHTSAKLLQNSSLHINQRLPILNKRWYSAFISVKAVVKHLTYGVSPMLLFAKKFL